MYMILLQGLLYMCMLYFINNYRYVYWSRYMNSCGRLKVIISPSKLRDLCSLCQRPRGGERMAIRKSKFSVRSRASRFDGRERIVDTVGKRRQKIGVRVTLVARAGTFDLPPCLPPLNDLLQTIIITQWNLPNTGDESKKNKHQTKQKIHLKSKWTK